MAAFTGSATYAHATPGGMRTLDQISISLPGGGHAMTGALTCGSVKPDSAFDLPATVMYTFGRPLASYSRISPSTCSGVRCAEPTRNSVSTLSARDALAIA